jgi:hypothetical protein
MGSSRCALAASAVIALAAAVPARAQLCADPAATVAAGIAVDVPDGHTRLDLVNASSAAGQPVPGFTSIPVAGTEWTPSAATVRELASIRDVTPPRPAFLRWSGGPGGGSCTQSFSLEGPRNDNDKPFTPPAVRAAPEAGAPASETGWSEGQCAQAASRWRSEIRREVGSERFTQLVFLENRGICYRSRDYGVTGDPIYVAVFTDDEEAWDGVGIQYEPCAIESAAPSILVTDKAGTLGAFQSGVKEWVLSTYPPRTCYNSSVVVTVTGESGGNPLTARTTLEQSQRYRATLHLGAAFTELHDRSFALRPDGTGQRIYGQGPDDRGPEYYAAVVLYALPRYLPSLFGGERYAGRDVVHDQAVADRIGGVLGVGISDPRKQFVAGLSFEALAGVNLTGTWYFTRVTRLAEVVEGDLFTGTEEQIPTRQSWENEFALGVSIDLRYAAALLQR